ncbi:MAG: aminotransferase class I/II-fold pyridoxal phosphate-dependent enzyme [Solirubrobacterales bacterium]
MPFAIDSEAVLLAGDQDSTPYLDALIAFGDRDPARFHVPGHKGGYGADPKLREHLADALKYDIPRDMHGIDFGPYPTPADQAELLAAESFGAKQTWFLTNGATQGNHALALALAPLGARVVVQRNSHGSVADGLVLSGGIPAFVSPHVDHDLQIAHGVLPEDLSETLDENPDAKAVFIVSPTYYGTCADVATLAQIAHSRGIPLLVDQSWGSHFGRHANVPQSAMQLGADAVLTSIHKTVGSFTQSAMLHVADSEFINPDMVDRAVRLVRSTSPNGLLLVSLDAARRNLAVNGEALLSETLTAIDTIVDKIDLIPGLYVAGSDLRGHTGVHDTDPLRIVIDTRATGESGFVLADVVRERHDVIPELATDTVVVFVVGIAEDPANLDRLHDALVDAAARAEPRREPATPIDSRETFNLEQVVSPREAFLAASDVIPVSAAIDRVCGESIAVYPPGIPALLPGELISQDIVDHLQRQVAQGARLHGASDKEFKTIHVLPADRAHRPAL